MWKWMFSKVIKMREKVAIDLGQEDAEKPFLEHLEDLRTMLVRMASTLAVFVIGTFAFYHYLWDVVQYPIHLAGLDGKIQFFTVSPIGGFMALMNLSIAAGIVIAMPLLLYFLLQFVLPGLRSTEKKVLFPALSVGAGLFLLGASFAYFLVAPKALHFFFEFNQSINKNPQGTPDTTMWGIPEYAKFICQFVLLFGLAFELPVVVMALVKLDILSYKVMKGSRSWAAIGIAVVSAIIAPSPDPQTLLLIAVPLYSLYEICIWMAWWLDKRDRQLYPEFYKEKEEDEKAMEASDEWDNESYNPWGDDSGDEEEEKPKPRPAPAGTQAMSTPSDSSESTSTENSGTSTAPAVETPAVTTPEHASTEPNPPADHPAVPSVEPSTEPHGTESPKPEEPKHEEPKPASPDVPPPAPGTDPHHPHSP